MQRLSKRPVSLKINEEKKLMDIVTLLNIFNCYSSIFPMFPNNEKRKNCFLAACKIRDQNINLEEIDQNFPHGGLIGYGNSILDFFLARSKVFGLHVTITQALVCSCFNRPSRIV